MTDPALLHEPVLCFALLSGLGLASFWAVSLWQVRSHPHQHWSDQRPHPWSFWTCKDVEDLESLKMMHGFTGAWSPSGVILWIQCSPTVRHWTNPFTVEAKGLNYLVYVSVTGSATLTPCSLWPRHAQISECGNILLSVLCGHIYCWVQIPTTKARQTLSCVRNHSHPLASKYLPS